MPSLAPDVHIIAEQSGFHRRGDLSGAGRLGTIADDAGHHGQRIDDGVDDSFVPAAAEVSDARTGPRPRADGPAVGRQAADGGLFVDGGQVGSSSAFSSRA